MIEFIDSNLFTWIILPLLIFCARILDVSIGTIRLIFISKGLKKVAPILGFFEVLIWIVVIRQVITDIINFVGFIAYAAGFAAGTYVGMYIEERFARGKVLLRVIVKRESHKVVKNLRKKNFHLTTVEAEGNHGSVRILFLVLNTNRVEKALEVVRETNPKAFYTIENIRYAHEEHVPGSVTRKPVPFLYRHGK